MPTFFFHLLAASVMLCDYPAVMRALFVWSAASLLPPFFFPAYSPCPAYRFFSDGKGRVIALFFEKGRLPFILFNQTFIPLLPAPLYASFPESAIPLAFLFPGPAAPFSSFCPSSLGTPCVILSFEPPVPAGAPLWMSL